MELNKIYNMNCLQGLKAMEDESVDMVLTDPPYNISQNADFSAMKRTGLDFGEWDRGFDQTSYLIDLFRVIRGGGDGCYL